MPFLSSMAGFEGYGRGQKIATPVGTFGIYATGSFTANPLTIYNTPGTSTTISTLVYSGSNDDCFIVKYDKSGVAEWATRIAGNASDDNGSGIAVDSSGNLYVTGFISAGPMTFYDSPGVSSTIPTISGSGCFVVKYNPNGIAQWATFISGATFNSVNSDLKISVDNSNNVYVTGKYTGTCTVYNSPGTSTTIPTLANIGSNDVFIAKYNTNGVAQWATRIAGTGNDDGFGISVDSTGNVYVVGSYNSNPLTIYNSPGISTTIPTLTTSGSETFIAKFNTSGTAQWATRIVGQTFGFGISTDSSGNVYVCGRYNSTCTIFNAPGTSSTIPTLSSQLFTGCFIVKFDTNGIAQWATRTGNTNFTADEAYGIAVDSSGNVYVTGQYATNPLTIYNSPGTSTTIPTLANAGSRDCFIVKYNTSGTAQWATRIAGTGSDNGYSISVDSSGNVYVTGIFTSNLLTIYNSPGNSATLPTLTRAGSAECFIVVFNTSGTAQWATRVGGNATCSGRSIAVL